MDKALLGEALLFGAIIGAAFPLGALGARLNRWGHHGFAVVMAIGAGLLLAAALVELAPGAVETLGLVPAALTVIGAAAVYSVVNLWLAKRGAQNRKRCGGCVEQPSEADNPGSGSAIAVGTVMDAIPKDLSKPWQDPMASGSDRAFVEELRGVGLQQQEMPEWKKASLGKAHV